MKIRSITVSAARTMSLPKTYYANLRPSFSFTADLEDGEDAMAAAKQLHEQCESLLENQCDELLAFVAARQQARNRKEQQAQKETAAA